MAKNPTAASGAANEDLALQIALAFYVGANQVGEADGKMDRMEVEASYAVLIALTKDSKSELLRRAAGIIASGAIRPLVSSTEFTADDKVLEEVGKKIKLASLSDQYRFLIAFVTLCRAVSKASGGGFLKGGPVSEVEKDVTANMLAALAGSEIGQPLSAEYRLFAKAAEKFCSEQGL